MKKEIVSLLKTVESKLFEPMTPAGLAISIAVTGLFLYGLDTIYDSQNNLSKIKEDQLIAPPISQQCIPEDQLDMACWREITREECDGNNTLSRKDDVCETLEYWSYVQPVNIMR